MQPFAKTSQTPRLNRGYQHRHGKTIQWKTKCYSITTGKKQLALCTSSISTKKHIQTNQHKTRMNETHPINFESIPQISVLD
jgi:hypothetical protein